MKKFTLGSLLKTATKCTIKGAKGLTKITELASEKIVKDEETKEKIKQTTQNFSNKLEKIEKSAPEKVKDFVDASIIKCEECGGKAGKIIAEKCNCDEKTSAALEKSGEFVGKTLASTAAVGASIVAAGTSAATFKASVVTHGIANLGLGSMYVGIGTICAISGAVFNTKKTEVTQEESTQSTQVQKQKDGKAEE